MGLFHPNGKLVNYQECISAVAVLYSIFEVPFEIAFLRRINIIIYVLEILITSIFLIQILMNLNLTFIDPVDKRLLVTSRYKIVKRYLSFWFWIDILSTIPFQLIIGSEGSNSIRLLRILRLSRFVKITKASNKLKDFLENREIDPMMITALILAIQIFAIAHLIACFWYFIATAEFIEYVTNGKDPATVVSWLTEIGFQEDDKVVSRYIASLYFAVMSMLTVGFGDIHPVNTFERVYTLVVLLVGSILFGAIIGKVKEFIERRNLVPKSIEGKMEEFKLFLEEMYIPLNLKNEAKVGITFIDTIFV